MPSQKNKNEDVDVDVWDFGKWLVCLLSYRDHVIVCIRVSFLGVWFDYKLHRIVRWFCKIFECFIACGCVILVILDFFCFVYTNICADFSGVCWILVNIGVT